MRLKTYILLHNCYKRQFFSNLREKNDDVLSERRLQNAAVLDKGEADRVRVGSAAVEAHVEATLAARFATPLRHVHVAYKQQQQ